MEELYGGLFDEGKGVTCVCESYIRRRQKTQGKTVSQTREIRKIIKRQLSLRQFLVAYTYIGVSQAGV